jgi:hypothetical protein
MRFCLSCIAVSWVLAYYGYWRGGIYFHHADFIATASAGPLGRGFRPPARLLLTHIGPGAWAAAVGKDNGIVVIPAAAVIAAVAGIAVAAFVCSAATRLIAVPQPPPQSLHGGARRFLRRLLPVGPVATAAFLCLSLVIEAHVPALPLLLSPAGLAGLACVAQAVKSLPAPAAISPATTPSELLDMDRRASLALISANAVYVGLIWLLAGSVIASAFAAYKTASILIGVFLNGKADRQSTAWFRYLNSRFVLGVRRKLPWRMMQFLGDAHQRGLLRVSGLAYQFRHLLMQEQLAVSHAARSRQMTPIARQLSQVLVTLLAQARARWQQVRVVAPYWQTSWQVAQALPPDNTANASPASGTLRWVTTWNWKQYWTGTVAAAVALAGVILHYAPRPPGWAVPVAVITCILVSEGAHKFLSASARKKIRQMMPPGSRTVRVAPDVIEVVTATRADSIYPDDIEEIALRPVAVGGSARALQWYSIQARLTAASAVRCRVPGDRWLPLYWRHASSAELPVALVTVLEQLAGSRFDAWMARISRDAGAKTADAIAYQADRLVAKARMSDGLDPRIVAGIIASAAIVIFSDKFSTRAPYVVYQAVYMTALALTIALITVGVRRLYRSGGPPVYGIIPAGRWSVRVTADLIQVSTTTGSGPQAITDTLSLGPSDIEQVAVRDIPRQRWWESRCQAVMVQLSPHVTPPFAVEEGWLPLDWDDSTRPELFAALDRFTWARPRSGARKPAMPTATSIGRRTVRIGKEHPENTGCSSRLTRPHAGRNRTLLKVTVTAEIPWMANGDPINRRFSARMDPTLARSRIAQAVAKLVADRDVTTIADSGWHPIIRNLYPSQYSREYLITFQRGNRALAAEVTLSLRKPDVLTSEVRIAIFSAWRDMLITAGCKDGRSAELTPDELSAVLTAGWHTADEILTAASQDVPPPPATETATVTIALTRLDLPPGSPETAEGTDPQARPARYRPVERQAWIRIPYTQATIDEDRRARHSRRAITQLAQHLGYAAPDE